MKRYPKGHLLCIKHGLYEHVGISDGKGHIYENAYRTGGRGKVSLKDFSGGKEIIDIGIIPGSAKPGQIIKNAEALIANPKKYNLLFNNCEHFVREVCGVDIKSPQVQRAIFLAVSTAVALTANAPKIKSVAVETLRSKFKRKALINSLIGLSFGLLVTLAMRYRKKQQKHEKGSEI